VARIEKTKSFITIVDGNLEPLSLDIVAKMRAFMKEKKLPGLVFLL